MVPVILGMCLCVGFIVKKWVADVDNKYIPTICAVLGVALAVEHLPGLAINYTTLVLPMVLAWYIFTELGSIAENATDMGAPVPGWLTKLLAAGKTAVDKTAADDTDA